jgi:hypothetical protein
MQEQQTTAEFVPRDRSRFAARGRVIADDMVQQSQLCEIPNPAAYCCCCWTGSREFDFSICTFRNKDRQSTLTCARLASPHLIPLDGMRQSVVCEGRPRTPEFQHLRSYWTGHITMDLQHEFRKRASDCETMARLTRDPESKAHWRDLAHRFRQCAERTNTPLIKTSTSDRKTRASKRNYSVVAL